MKIVIDCQNNEQAMLDAMRSAITWLQQTDKSILEKIKALSFEHIKDPHIYAVKATEYETETVSFYPATELPQDDRDIIVFAKNETGSGNNKYLAWYDGKNRCYVELDGYGHKRIENVLGWCEIPFKTA